MSTASKWCSKAAAVWVSSKRCRRSQVSCTPFHACPPEYTRPWRSSSFDSGAAPASDPRGRLRERGPYHAPPPLHLRHLTAVISPSRSSRVRCAASRASVLTDPQRDGSTSTARRPRTRSRQQPKPARARTPSAPLHRPPHRARSWCNQRESRRDQDTTAPAHPTRSSSTACATTESAALQPDTRTVETHRRPPDCNCGLSGECSLAPATHVRLAAGGTNASWRDCTMMRPSQSTTRWSSSNQSCPICMRGAHHAQPPVGGHAAQIGRQLDGGRPTEAVDAERHRGRHVTAQEREQDVGRALARAHPVLDDRWTAVGTRGHRGQRRPDVAAVREVDDVGHRMTGPDRLEPRRRIRRHQRHHRIHRQQRGATSCSGTASVMTARTAVLCSSRERSSQCGALA